MSQPQRVNATVVCHYHCQQGSGGSKRGRGMAQLTWKLCPRWKFIVGDFGLDLGEAT
ncbi:hypothetical protein PISMIDRAFT_677246 [Pisolithus microcarpus 441]|uniref:Uncharacterized protein n=1 Tax=Pisolithus microcarpus 441 TaxID=765257 RepID=A0A0C9ZTM3_9AGAM|nr:hypothetical protein PISMIDRAFT_677246 [Pisolithus microcarpus 441]